MLEDILNRKVPLEDKVNRIIAMDSEKHNAEICDYMVEVTTYEDAVEQICDGLRIGG